MGTLIYGVGSSNREGVVVYREPLWAAGQCAAQVEKESGRDVDIITSGIVQTMQPGDKLAITRDGVTYWIECKTDD